MKISVLCLVGSVALNLILAGLLLFGPAETPASAPRTVAPRPAAASASAGPEKWNALRADDLAAQRDRLRAEGFPPDVVRAILAAGVRERFAARRKALETAQGDQPFWKDPSNDPARRAELRALYKEESAALKSLLGADPDNPMIANLRRQLPGFSDERLEQLAGIRERYDEQRQALYGTTPGGMTPDEREKIRTLEKAQHDEIAAVLTPPELEEYDLRTSNVANNLRYNLTAFDVTEAEFRSLYRLQSDFEAAYPPIYSALPLDQARLRGDAERRLQDDIRTALGPDRYATYQRATDYEYRQSTQLVARLGLAPATADQLFTLREEIQSRLGSAHALPAESRNAQLAAMASEAQTKITALLGTQGYEAYKTYGGMWLRNLAPPPPPRRPPTR